MNPIPVAAPHKVAAYVRSCAGIAGSNPAGARYLSLVSVVCCQVESYRVLCVWVWSRNLTGQAEGR